MADTPADKTLDLTVARAIRLLHSGATVDQALRESAHEHGVSIAAIRRHARATNIALTPTGEARKSHAFVVALTVEAQDVAIARVAALVGDGRTQTAALEVAAAEVGVTARTLTRYARSRGIALAVPASGRHQAVANAVIGAHTVTLQRQRDLVQVLLRVADTGISLVESQARKGAEKVDWTLFGRLTTKLSELHTLDNALMLQVGRYDATASRAENERRVRDSALNEVDEYAEQWRRDAGRFGVDVLPEHEPTGTEGIAQ